MVYAIHMNTNEFGNTYPEQSRFVVVITDVQAQGLRRHARIIGAAYGAPVDLTAQVADLCGLRTRKSDGAITLTGAGMDMRWHLLHELGRTVHGNDLAYRLS